MSLSRGSHFSSQALPTSCGVYSGHLVMWQRGARGCPSHAASCSLGSAWLGEALRAEAGAWLPHALLPPGTAPGPWQRAGRLPGEEVVIFLNDFKG